MARSSLSPQPTIPLDSISYLIHSPTSRLLLSPSLYGKNDTSLGVTNNGTSPNNTIQGKAKRCDIVGGHHHAVTRLVPHSFKHNESTTNETESSSSTSSTVGDSLSLFSSSRDATVREWDLSSHASQAATLRTLYVGHSNWINDFALIPNSSDAVVLVTASNDKTLRIWTSGDLQEKAKDHPKILTSRATLVHHTDYVTCVSAASKASPCIIASGSNDQRVAIWDLEKLVPTITLRRGEPLYSCTLLANTNGTVYVERPQTIRSLELSDNGYFLSCANGRDLTVWDTRINKPAYDIKDAHNDLIRRFNVTFDGKHGISTSFDGSIYLWDFRKSINEPYKEIDFHSDSVWALWSDPRNPNLFFTGDRQGAVVGFRANDCNPCFWMGAVPSHQLQEIPEEQQWTVRSILDVAFHPESYCLWASSSDSTIACWNLEHVIRSPTCLQRRTDSASKAGSYDDTSVAPFPSLPSKFEQLKLPVEPNYIIPGFPKLRQFRLLKDQRIVVTQSLLLDIDTWDIVQGTHLASFGKIDFGDVVARNSIFLSVPVWCSIDIILGCLRITLKAHNAFAAETLSLGASTDTVLPLNYGCKVLDRLFWSYNKILEAPLNIHNGCSLVTLEASRTLPSDHAHDNALWTYPSCQLSTSKRYEIPSWIKDWMIDRRFIENSTVREVTVYFLPAPNSELMPLQRNQFTCKRWTPISRVSPNTLANANMQIVTFIASTLKLDISQTSNTSMSQVSKVLKTTSVCTSSSSISRRPSTPTLRLSCMHHTLNVDWDIGTVRELIWKKNQIKGRARPFEIHYDIVAKKKPPTPPPLNGILSRILSRRNKQGSSCLTPDTLGDS